MELKSFSHRRVKSFYRVYRLMTSKTPPPPVLTLNNFRIGSYIASYNWTTFIIWCALKAMRIEIFHFFTLYESTLTSRLATPLAPFPTYTTLIASFFQHITDLLYIHVWEGKERGKKTWEEWKKNLIIISRQWCDWIKLC